MLGFDLEIFPADGYKLFGGTSRRRRRFFEDGHRLVGQPVRVAGGRIPIGRRGDLRHRPPRRIHEDRTVRLFPPDHRKRLHQRRVRPRAQPPAEFRRMAGPDRGEAVGVVQGTVGARMNRHGANVVENGVVTFNAGGERLSVTGTATATPPISSRGTYRNPVPRTACLVRAGQRAGVLGRLRIPPPVLPGAAPRTIISSACGRCWNSETKPTDCMEKTLVVTPTYNEADNIEKFIGQVLSQDPVDRDAHRGRQLPRRNGAIVGRDRRPEPRDPHPEAGRARWGSAPPTSHGFRYALERVRLHLRDGRRLLATTRSLPAIPRGDPGLRPGDGLALPRRRHGSVNWPLSAGSS